MLKKLLIVNDLTCRISNKKLLVVISCVFALRAHAISLAVTGCMSALLCARVRAHCFARYLTFTVKICTLGSNAAVEISGSLIL